MDYITEAIQWNLIMTRTFLLGTMKITFLQQRNTKSWDLQNYGVYEGFVISDLFITRFTVWSVRKFHDTRYHGKMSVGLPIFGGYSLKMGTLEGYQ